MVGDDAHARLCGEALLGPLGKPEADTVIRAQRVATGEDEAAGCGLSHESALYL
jgi:hypothetical protein